MEGYSVAKGQYGFIVLRNEQAVAHISLSPFKGKPGFDWHDQSMWSFKSSDFVICASTGEQT